MLWASRTFERYFGLDHEALQGEDFRQLTMSHLRPAFADGTTIVKELLRGTDAKRRRVECHVLASETRAERWLEHWSQPIRSGEHAGGRIDYFYDITERRRAEEAARKSEDQLVQAQKMEAVGRLAGGLAHDFNNLLTAIDGYADLILRHSDGPRIKVYIGEVRKASARAVDLTSKLLALSRRAPASQRVLDLNQVVHQVEGLLRRLIGDDVELETRLAPSLGRIWSDPGQLEQILLNLVVNARDAMPTGGRLLIQTSNAERRDDSSFDLSAESSVCLTVSDTGAGIDPEIREHIFEPFFTTKEEGKGTGLGLSTVYAMVAQNEGSIELDSKPGKGTTFRIYLPSVAAEPEASDAAPDRAPAQHGHETILLVEDDESVRRLVKEILEQHGYQVIDAENGARALELAEVRKETIDFLVTDVVMPVISGPDLADRLSKMIPGLRILFISGYTDSLVLRHGLLDAEHVMLQKPFDGSLLASKIREILDQPPEVRNKTAFSASKGRSAG